MDCNEKEVLLMSQPAPKDEDVTDTEDQQETQEEIAQRENIVNSCCAKFMFVVLGIILMLSATAVTVLFPVYTELLNQRGDIYTAALFTSFVTTAAFSVCILVGKAFKNLKFSFTPPFTFSALLRCGILFGGSCLLIMYSLERKKVACHLQDPIKGVVVLFSFMFYFFLSKTEMSIQKMFCTSTIISGVFISVDFGLCDEFRCRGFERITKSDDVGDWKWPTHTVWTILYVVALGLFSLFYTLLEGLLLTHQGDSYDGTNDSRLATVSRLVASRDSRPLLQIADDNEENQDECHYNNHDISSFQKPAKQTISLTLSIGFWIHLITFLLVICFCWSDMIPIIGKASSPSEFWNFTSTGLLCHFGHDSTNLWTGNSTTFDVNICNDLALYSWLFIVAYIIFTFSSIYFLIMSESAVFTLALAVAAMPLSNMWWSLFRLNPVNLNSRGIMEVHLSLTGELISAFLGFPLMLIGIFLFFRAYFIDKIFDRLNVSEA